MFTQINKKQLVMKNDFVKNYSTFIRTCKAVKNFYNSIERRILTIQRFLELVSIDSLLSFYKKEY